MDDRAENMMRTITEMEMKLRKAVVALAEQLDIMRQERDEAREALRSIAYHGITLPMEVEASVEREYLDGYARGVDSCRRIALSVPEIRLTR